jgi:hypothetical protein
MNAKTEKCLPVELERARVELTAWRERRGPGEHRIPEEVWRQAVLAARRCGLNPVSQALGLDYNGLKRHVGVCATRRPVRSRPLFVEVNPPPMEAELGCVVELQKGNGARLRICIGRATAVDWGKVKEAFLGA